jgi:hypothetical protein
MKHSKSTMFVGAILFGLSMCFTSCEDILGTWDKPTPTNVTPSGGGDDGGGSTPSAYTMAKDATSTDKGKLICADGHIHANGADAACTKARVAIITYVGSDNGESAPYNHGLALAMSDAGGSYWRTSSTDAGHDKQTDSNNFTSESGLQYNATHNTDEYPAFKAAIANNGTAAPTGCSAWFLASGYQWTKMFAGDAGGLKTLAGLVSGGFYWSSSENDAGYAWVFYSNDGDWNLGSKDFGSKLVRACLAF